MLAIINGNSCRAISAELLTVSYLPGTLNTTTATNPKRTAIRFITQSYAVGSVVMSFEVKNTEGGAKKEANLDSLLGWLGNKKNDIEAGSYHYIGTVRAYKQYELVNSNALIVEIILDVRKCKDREEKTSKTFTCTSTVPRTDCVITLTANAAGTNVYVRNNTTGDNVTLASVSAGDVIEINAEECTITKNGQHIAAQAVFTSLIGLAPGQNSISCSASLTFNSVEYSPTVY